MREQELAAGVTQADSEAYNRSKLRIRDLQTAESKSLRDWDRDFAFFTPALLYTCVPLAGAEPFHDFLKDYGQNVEIGKLSFDRPIFEISKIPEEVAWNHSLFLIEMQHAKAYFRWLGTLIFRDSPNKLLFRVRLTTLALKDPIAAEPSLIYVAAVNIETNRGCFYLKPTDNPLQERPSLQFTKFVFEDTKKMAEALHKEETNPYGEKAAILDQRYPNMGKCCKLEDLPASHQQELIEFVRRGKRLLRG